MSKADGEYKKMCYHRGVLSPHSIQHIHERPVPYLEVEQIIEEALGELTHYYRSNSLRANPDKMQVTAFLLRNRETKRLLQVLWNGVDL